MAATCGHQKARPIAESLERIAGRFPKAQLTWDGMRWTLSRPGLGGIVETWGPTEDLPRLLDIMVTDEELDAVLDCPRCNGYLEEGS